MAGVLFQLRQRFFEHRHARPPQCWMRRVDHCEPPVMQQEPERRGERRCNRALRDICLADMRQHLVRVHRVRQHSRDLLHRFLHARTPPAVAERERRRIVRGGYGDAADILLCIEDGGVICFIPVVIVAADPEQREHRFVQLSLERFRQPNCTENLVDRVERAAEECRLLTGRDEEAIAGENLFQPSGRIADTVGAAEP